jgi:hypothetical protein
VTTFRFRARQASDAEATLDFLMTTTSPKEDNDRMSFYTSPPEEWFDFGLERLRAVAEYDPAKAREIAQATIERIRETVKLDETFQRASAEVGTPNGRLRG